MRARTRLAALVWPVLALASCNAILDNAPPVAAAIEDAGTEAPPQAAPPAAAPEPTAAPALEASVLDAPRDAPRDGPSPITCGAGQRACYGACVDLSDPIYGCGDPSCVPCALANAIPTCKGSKCAAATCYAGFDDCNGAPEDGCEADLSRQATCGTCKTACPPTAPYCAPAGAIFACTTGCPATAPVLCGKDCADTQTSREHCGRCDVRCADAPNASVACVAGACVTTCLPGFHACGGKCILSTDPSACGPTCAPCPAPPNGLAACVTDACAIVCSVGFADCDRVAANGCEAELARDPLHCGVCGTACDPGGSCVEGGCVAPVVDAGTPPADAGEPADAGGPADAAL